MKYIIKENDDLNTTIKHLKEYYINAKRINRDIIQMKDLSIILDVLSNPIDVTMLLVIFQMNKWSDKKTNKKIINKQIIERLDNNNHSDDPNEFIKKYIESSCIKDKRFIDFEVDALLFSHCQEFFTYLRKTKSPGLSLKNSQRNRDIMLPQNIIYALHFPNFFCQDRLL